MLMEDHKVMALQDKREILRGLGKALQIGNILGSKKEENDDSLNTHT